MNAAHAIRPLSKNQFLRAFVFGFIVCFTFKSDSLSAKTAADHPTHRIAVVREVGGFQETAAAFFSRPLTNATRVCVGIPREGFSGNPAWATRNEHQAATKLGKHLFDNYDFQSAQKDFPAHSPTFLAKWPIDPVAHLGINRFCETKSGLGRFWNWARVTAMAKSPLANGFPAPARIALAPDGDGFWLANPDGKVMSFGSAKNFGSVKEKSLHSSVVGIAARPQGDGYWLVTGEGEVFAFGNAPRRGSMRGEKLNQPIVGICPIASGNGYWLVAKDGGVFSFDAPFKGALGATGMESIVGMAATPGDGYWLLRSDGEVFAFEAPFQGSMSDEGFKDFTSIVANADGSGYWLMRENGAIYTFNVGKKDGFDPTLQLMTTLLGKSSLQTYSRAHEIQQYNARIWQSDDGLPHNAVQAVAQSRDGYLWAGTVEGFARFDGVRFSKAPGSGLSSNVNTFISALAQAADGSVWIGAENGGLFRWKDGQYFSFNQTNGVLSDRVRALCCASDGSIWIGTTEGLSRFQNGKFSNYTVADGLAHNVVRALCEDREGGIWIGTGDGLQRILRGRIVTTMRGGEGLPNGAIRSLLTDKEGDLWVGSNGGLTRMRENKFTTYTRNDGLLENTVSALFEDRKGNLWIGTLGGLNRMVDGRILTETSEAGAFYDWIYSITGDIEGNIWVGMKNGLGRLSPKRFATYTRQDGLTHNSVMSVCEDRSDTLWIGTWGGGLTKMKDGKFSAFPLGECAGNGLVLSMEFARDGAVWLGMDFDGGLIRWKDGQCARYRAEQGLIDPAIAVIHEDRKGGLWLGTRTALVLFQDGKFTRYTTVDGLAANSVKAILEDRSGDLWIGTTNGLSRFRNGKFANFTPHAALSSSRINALHEDGEGNLWIGTVGAGLVRLKIENENSRMSDGDSSRITHHVSRFTSHDGLFNDTIFEIIADRRGNFWFTSPKGVFRIRKRDLEDFEKGKISRIHSVSFGKADGMVSIQCHGISKPAGCLTRDGRLWLPTATGLVSAEPNIRLNETPPPVFIEEVVVDRKKLEDRGSKMEGGKPDARTSPSSILHPPPSLQIPPGRGELEFHYTALSFQWPEKNRFKYKLAGVDPDWVDAGTRRVAYYNNIPPGRYEFQVIGSNSDGVWNQLGSSVRLTLLPHFWQTWAFKAAMFTLGSGFLIFLYRLRMAQFRKIEQLRVRIAADLHDEVGSSLWSISLLSGLLQKNENLTDDDRNDAAEINRIALQTANSVRDIVWFIKPEYDTMQDLVLRMRDVAGTLLVGMEHRFQNSQEDMSRKLPIDFRQNVFLMYKEILTNVAKHSQAKCVEIDISERNGFWQLRISDNGVGFDVKSEFQGSGLKNLRHRAGKLKGELEIRSQKGNGMTMVFSKRFR